jgi:hypothetical protein
MTSLGVPERRKRPIERRDANSRKTHNFLPSRLGLGIVFQKLRLELRCWNGLSGATPKVELRTTPNPTASS